MVRASLVALHAVLTCGGALAVPALSGIFLTMYEQDVKFTAQGWAQELDEMRSVGIRTVIVGESASNTWPNYSIATAPPVGAARVRVQAFWPTNLSSTIPGYDMIRTGYEPLEHILSAADSRNMSVILGNADVPWVDQGGKQDWKMQAALSYAILEELWGLYSHHPSLAGFCAPSRRARPKTRAWPAASPRPQPTFSLLASRAQTTPLSSAATSATSRSDSRSPSRCSAPSSRTSRRCGRRCAR